MMPKLSVSIPDDLWEEAQAATPNMGASQLVQAALRKYVARPGGRSPFARNPSDENRALLSEAVQRVAERARATYDQGYRAGLEFAASSPWELLEDLQRLDWKLDRLLSEYNEELEAIQQSGSYGAPKDEPAGAPFLERVTEAMGTPYRQESVYREGFADALQDIWTQITGGGGEESGGINPDDLPFE